MSDAGGERQSGAARRRRRRRRGSGAGRGSAPRAVQGPAQSGAGGRTTSGAGAKAGRTTRGKGRTGSTRAATSGGARPSGRPATPGEPGTRRLAAASPAGDPRRAKERQRGATAGDTYAGAHELADAQNEERRRANTRRLRLLAGGLAAAPAIVLGVVFGVAFGTVAGAAVAVVLFLAVTFLVATASFAFALRMVGGVTVRDSALPALANQVAGLCATLGVTQPELRVVEDPVANACALAGRGGRAVLVVTSGLLERLGLIEMEGVVAHELVHVRRRDAAVSAMAIATAGVVAWATRRDELVHLAVGRGREYGADQAAVLAVRYPPGLHDALGSLGGAPPGPGSPFSGRRWAATRWVWIEPMVGVDGRVPRGELDATAVRMDALAEL